MGLDTVELIMAIEECFEIEIPDGDAQQMPTVAKLIDYVFDRVGSMEFGGCASRSAYYRFRAGVRGARSDSRLKIPLEETIGSLCEGYDRSAFWNAFRGASELRRFEEPSRFLDSATTREFVDIVLREHFNGKWPRAKLRGAVRAIVVETGGVDDDFGDDAHLVNDLGFD